MNYYLKVLKEYGNFSGRARRKEYWMFILFNMIFSIAAIFLDYIIGYGLFYGIYALALLIPAIAVSVRRLHDIGKSGWMLLIVLIPLIGSIWLLILMATDSNPGENQYGENPKIITN